MIVKKLAVPFVNDKLLQQVEHVYIATSALSEAGFDFIRSRIPTKTKMDIVTGLDSPTSPEVLRRIWRNYQGRITLNIYTKNTFHANLYLLDLPFRKSVAFIGSGSCTLEGIKDGEELFYKITDAKEIENLKSWFTGYFEFGEPLTENLIQEYETRYPLILQREIQSKEDKKQFIGLTTAGFSWEHINLRNHYFKKEDYLVLSSSKATLSTPQIHAERMELQRKLLQLDEQIQKSTKNISFPSVTNPHERTSSLIPADHTDRILQSMSLLYRLKQGNDIANSATSAEANHLEIALHQKELSISLVIGKSHGAKNNRDYFKRKMNDVEYRKNFFLSIGKLDPSYTIVVAGDFRNVNSFANEDVLWEFTKSDHWMFDFLIKKRYTPADPELKSEAIALTLARELEKLAEVSIIIDTPLPGD